MLRACLGFFFVAFFLLAPSAHADDSTKATSRGIAVVASGDATDAAWPLARAIYSSTYLRPEKIDDEHARVLAGEKRETQQPSIVELEELRAAVKGDDAASRQVLTAIADKLGVASVLVVFAGSPPIAQMFDAHTHAFDAAHYSPDASGSWAATIRSLERPFVPAQTEAEAQTQATAQSSQTQTSQTPSPSPSASDKKSKQFYESPWFWVAIGAAVLIGGGILIGTNVQTGDTIHMQLKLP